MTSVGSGTGLSGGPITSTGTLSIATAYQLPQSCATNQVPKWSGSAWITRDDSGRGTMRLKNRPETLAVSLTFMSLFKNM